MTWAVLAAVLGYALGSIPFGLVLSRLAGLGDIRAIGSGNIGATNVLRSGRKDIAALTLVLDAAKGAAAALLIGLSPDPDVIYVAGIAAILGHCTSPWVGFRGGKGVATALGVILAWSWPAGLACCAIWLAVAFISKLSSLSALAAILAAPALLFFADGIPGGVAGLIAAVIVLVRHEANIRRLMAGTEPRIGAK